MEWLRYGNQFISTDRISKIETLANMGDPKGADSLQVTFDKDNTITISGDEAVARLKRWLTARIYDLNPSSPLK